MKNVSLKKAQRQGYNRQNKIIGRNKFGYKLFRK
jgi:hypothetical protein